MYKENKTIKKQREEIRQLKKERTELKNENNVLVLENQKLQFKNQELEQQLKNYHTADKYQLTTKEDFKISIPFFTFIFITVIAITIILYKNDSSIYGYYLAVISLIISIISTLFDFIKTFFNKHTFKNPKLINFSENIEKSNSILLGLFIAVSMGFFIYWVFNPNPDIVYSNLICSITLLIYFIGLFINKYII